MKRGQVVRSLAGRDKGRFYAVLCLEGKAVFLVDGKLHPLERPKRKNLRHLQHTQTVFPAEVLEANGRLEKALRAFNAPGKMV